VHDFTQLSMFRKLMSAGASKLLKHGQK
jgi:hypothetical protein